MSRRSLYWIFWKFIRAGTLVSVVLALVISLAITPSSIQWQGGADHTEELLPVSPRLYWMSVIGFTAWFAFLGFLFSAFLGGIRVFMGWIEKSRDESR
ncbi:hypothetical protein [Salinithrix halophila]|uniref:Uncharacterized protein n=1 Tax=Salinithrix halophila TaxID=1485204 RepID=A0ABV8JDG6_9BACL